jgi:predicted dinucleotide-binding enzyme
MMKIGFIGIGNVGGTLAKSLGAKGHSIYLGARDPNSEDAICLNREIGVAASVQSIPETIEKSDVIVLATPWKISADLVREYETALRGKILIDCTNPLKADLSGLEVGHTQSGAELLQTVAKETKVFKAFNTTGFNIMADPVLEGKKAVMFYCGDNQSSRHIIQQIIQDVGFEPIDAGNLSAARLLEPFALLWISSAYKFGLGRDFAFTIVRRK